MIVIYDGTTHRNVVLRGFGEGDGRVEGDSTDNGGGRSLGGRDAHVSNCVESNNIFAAIGDVRIIGSPLLENLPVVIVLWQPSRTQLICSRVVWRKNGSCCGDTDPGVETGRRASFGIEGWQRMVGLAGRCRQ